MAIKFGPLIGSGFYSDASGSGAGYTTEQAQDAIGSILVDTASIELTYTDAPPSITADLPVAITAGEYGGPGNDLQFTVNNKGIITAISETSVSVLASSISDFVEKSQDAAANAIASTSSLTKTYNDPSNTIQLSAVYSATTPLSLGTASAGSSNSPARRDHVHGHSLTSNGDIIQYSSGVSRLAIGSANKFLMSDGASLNYQTPSMIPGVFREVFDDFLTGSFTGLFNLSSSTSGGSAVGSNTPEAGVFGFYSVQTGATASGRAMIYNNSSANLFQAETNTNFDVIFKIKMSAVSGSSENYFAFFGITDKTGTTGEPTNGVYFYHDQNSANWVIKNSASSVRSSTTTSVAVDTNWNVFKIKITGHSTPGSGTNEFFINGTSVGSLTTNSTPSLGGPTFYIEKSLGTTSRFLYADFINVIGYF